MADPFNESYQQGYSQEVQTQALAERRQTEQLQRQKLMLDLIRSQTPLAPEDARDLARLNDLNEKERARLFTSTYTKNPEVFQNILQYTNNMDRTKQMYENALNMQSLRDMLLRARTEIGPDTWASVFESVGRPVPPYAEGATWERAIGLLNAGTAAERAQNAGSTGPNSPATNEYISGMIDSYGWKGDPSILQGQTRAGVKDIITGAASENYRNKGREVRLRSLGEMQDYAFGKIRPPDIGDKPAGALADRIGAMAMDAPRTMLPQDVIDKIIEFNNIAPGTHGGDAKKALKNLRAPDWAKLQQADQFDALTPQQKIDMYFGGQK